MDDMERLEPTTDQEEAKRRNIVGFTALIEQKNRLAVALYRTLLESYLKRKEWGKLVPGDAKPAPPAQSGVIIDHMGMPQEIFVGTWPDESPVEESTVIASFGSPVSPTVWSRGYDCTAPLGHRTQKDGKTYELRLYQFGAGPFGKAPMWVQLVI